MPKILHSLIAFGLLCIAGSAQANLIFFENFNDPAALGTSFVPLRDALHGDLTPTGALSISDGELFTAKHDRRGPVGVGTSSTFTLPADGSIAVKMRAAPFIDPLPQDDIIAAGTNRNGAFIFSMFFTDGFEPAGTSGTISGNPNPDSRFEIGLRMRNFDGNENAIEVFGRGSGVQAAEVLGTVGYDQPLILQMSVLDGDLTLTVFDDSLTSLGSASPLGTFSLADEAGGRLAFSQNGKFDWVQAAYVDAVAISSGQNAAAALVPVPAAIALLLPAALGALGRQARRAGRFKLNASA